jgi:hypothetical protein
LRLDYATARAIGESLSGHYCFADPFPHIVLDNFLPEPVARLALEHFPAQTLRSDRVFEMGYAGLHKRQILPEDCDAPARSCSTSSTRGRCSSSWRAVDHPGACCPTRISSAAAITRPSRGGKLGVHADFRINDQLHLHRRMNVIIYLNERWQDEWGGFLELWDRKMTAKVKAVAPVFNRCVIFNTDATRSTAIPTLSHARGVLRARSRCTTTPRRAPSTRRCPARRRSTTPARATTRRRSARRGAAHRAAPAAVDAAGAAALRLRDPSPSRALTPSATLHAARHACSTR